MDWPCDDDEHVESVPRFVEIGLLADQAHRDDLNAHLGGEERENEVIATCQDSTSDRRADLIDARLVHAQSQAVEQDHTHANPLKPRSQDPQSRT